MKCYESACFCGLPFAQTLANTSGFVMVIDHITCGNLIHSSNHIFNECLLCSAPLQHSHTSLSVQILTF